MPVSEVADRGDVTRPVFMVIAGVTRDPARMAVYAKALAESGLYDRLGGYYVNKARPVAVFEGDVDADLVTLIVRFPSVAAARAFWTSGEYQDRIRPMRLNPSAGDYSVTVYDEAELPAYMRGRVGDGAYATKTP